MNNTHNGNPTRPQRPARSPGGQPGNQNARKHGRYSAHVPVDFSKEADAVGTAQLRTQVGDLRDLFVTLVDDPTVKESLILRTAGALCALRKLLRKRYRSEPWL